MSNDYNKIFAKDIEKLEEEVPKTEVNEEGEEVQVNDFVKKETVTNEVILIGYI